MVTLALLTNATVLVAAFVVGLTLRRGPRRRVVLAVAVALGLCLFKVALLRRPDLETRLFPWPNYALFSGWLAPLGMLALGAMTGLVRMRRDWVFIVVGTLATLVYFGDYLDWLSGSAGLSIKPRLRGERAMQTTSYTCGPAAAATMLLAAGIPTDEAEMATLCLTRRGRGTPDLGLFRGLNLKLRQTHTALSVRLLRLSYDDLFRVPKPCILRVRFGFDHTVVLLGTVGRRLRIYDPAAPYNNHLWDRRMLEEEAKWSGYAFVFYRADGQPLPPVRVRIRPPLKPEHRLARNGNIPMMGS